ncbi:MAG: hypothetical protein ACRCXC_11960 [Legionella sp.]
MSIESDELLSAIIARLPELEWKINGLGSSLSSQSLPKGLFRFTKELSGAACIAEIKADIHTLSQQQNQRSAFYLAEQIRKKINVLVVLCQMTQRKRKPEKKTCFGIKMLSTRQQWINDLEVEIHTLIAQQQAMIKTLENLKYSRNANAILHLQAELGEVERRLTLAQETLKRVVS